MTQVFVEIIIFRSLSLNTRGTKILSRKRQSKKNYFTNVSGPMI